MSLLIPWRCSPDSQLTEDEKYKKVNLLLPPSMPLFILYPSIGHAKNELAVALPFTIALFTSQQAIVMPIRGYSPDFPYQLL